MEMKVGEKQGKEEVEDSNSSSSAEEDDKTKGLSKTVFIKNLNFSTTEDMVEALFKNANLKGKILSVKIVRRSDN